MAAASLTYAQLGRWNEALEEAQKELSIAEEYHDVKLATYAYWNISNPYTVKRDAAKAVEYAQIAVKKAPTAADKLWAETLPRSQSARGSRSPGVAARKVDSGQFAPGQAFVRLYLGEAYWRNGQLDDAEQTLRQGS